MNKEKQPKFPVVASLPDEPKMIAEAIANGFSVTIQHPLIYADGSVEMLEFPQSS